ncbi:glycoside hydrolase family 92 protein [Curvularia clavata]|uniref:Glycoside hydrolase family 92 protein n=1 Tax=Curvularia clavata TaxID=95742 RepID=A0A9Q8ZB94_CURCL|nr:glycoside hydrolase family 92 protein [Curvularia clavata]
MTLTLREVSDEEILRACEIEVLAYKDNALGPIIAPGPFPSDALQQRSQQLAQGRKDDPTVSYLQAYDDAAGKMVAFAKWHIFETSASVAASTRPLVFGPGRNVEACQLFFGGMAERKEAIMGKKPHVYLSLLHTDPEFQGRGAGSLLLDWGKKKADELGLPIYLESSTAGHRLYQKHGFEDVEIFQADFTPYGGPIHDQPLMIRPAAKTQ